ncbi:unnamed protein product [Pieris macdunnoughi]|uniref:Endonuclease/exonuclease/phosphatase domain-containing protein n=1 Tax=Pieris macdunnoughi TaxID=345717 RepID=A0A821XK52_9NEOP|nr:unnamed protein product [Pieris macdunnoughi]
MEPESGGDDDGCMATPRTTKKRKMKEQLPAASSSPDDTYKPYFIPEYKRSYPDNSSKEEFPIYVEGINEKIGNKNPLYLSKFFKNVKDIVEKRSKIMVVFIQAVAANDFLSHSCLKENKLKAYIPAASAERTGTIRFVDKESSNAELYEKLMADAEIIAVRRFTKKVGQEIVPLTTVSVTFVGTSLPQYVFLDKWRYRVYTYVPPLMQCFKCMKFRNIVKQLPKPCIVSGDLNAHHVTFGCEITNPRGRELLDLFDECNLCLLNTGAPTTVGRPGCNASVIDVTCVSPDLAPLCEWRVGDDAMGSYHLQTFTDIIVSTTNYQVNDDIDKFLFNKTNWESYHNLSEALFTDFNSNSDSPLQKYDEMCKIINILRNVCVPVYRCHAAKTCRAPAPWWSEDCAEAVNKSKDALAKYRNDMTIENYIDYKRLNARKKMIIKEAKSSS